MTPEEQVAVNSVTETASELPSETAEIVSPATTEVASIESLSQEEAK